MPRREAINDDAGIFEMLLDDGRFLIVLTGFCLLLSGGFALFQSATGHFLPHDIAYLGMQADELCSINECRIVHFMFHDRVSFAGVLIGIGMVYMWLAASPLRNGDAWAWWALAISGAVGFASFLAYLGYGYLDSWHGAATLALLPCFVTGMLRSSKLLHEPSGPRALLVPSTNYPWLSAVGVGKMLLLLTALGIMGAGVTITAIGMINVFVPQDLEFMDVTADYLNGINPRLVPLIAHDRAGFGGGLCSGGLALLACIWCAKPTRSLWEVLALVGAIGFTCAIGIHFVVGYVDVIHLAPAVVGACMYLAGILLTFPGRDSTESKGRTHSSHGLIAAAD
jgi:hypothetical protein